MTESDSTQVSHDKIITDNNFIGLVTELIRNSVHKIYIIFYYVSIHTSWKSCEIRTFLDVLIEKQKKGIEIKVLMNHSAQKNILYTGLKNSFDYLQKNNVPVKHTPQGRTTHAKLILCDGNKFVIGSHNFSLTSLHRNREISIYVENKNLCEQLESYFLEHYHNAINIW
jgi:phosphatidylserine/phosphatidylglycerophosphate/cardiolipin synthase-like enzyme